MNELIESWLAFLRAHNIWLKWLSLASLITFLATPLIVMVIIIKLPPDYFARSATRKSSFSVRHRAAYLFFMIIKNSLGLLLILIGFLLLFLPGQGFLTILIGLLLINFPGKSRLERAILSRPGIRETINKWRQRFHQPPLTL